MRARASEIESIAIRRWLWDRSETALQSGVAADRKVRAPVAVSRCVGLVLMVAMVHVCRAANPGATNELRAPTVGMEGHVQIMMPGTVLEARPVEPKARLLLRVAEARPHGTLFDYDLRYIGFVPGKYDLRDYLVRKDGSSTNDLPKIPVEVVGVLSNPHRGELVAQEVRALPFLGGYKKTLIAVTVAWASLFIFMWWKGRKPKTAEPVKIAAGPPTLAERLRPLVARAAEGTLSKDELAHLERLLLSHWRERLGLREESMAEAMQQLRRHPEAGALLRELENWLHRRPGSVKVDVNTLLAPYRQTVEPAPAGQ